MSASSSADSSAALLTVEEVSFAYRRALVFEAVSFAVGPGELIALCGPNGAGKSTLLRLVLGMHAPSAGTVKLGGADLTTLSRREVARRAALLPQETAGEVPLSVREVVGLGRLPHLGRFQPESADDAAAVERALAATDTGALAERPVAELSGGERHRVHLARVLAQEAPLLLLDEPIAGLDLAHQLETLELLAATVQTGRSAIVALHDLSLAARHCSRILLLADGRLRADASPRAVLTPETLAARFGVQADVVTDPSGRPLIVARASLGRGGSSPGGRTP